MNEIPKQSIKLFIWVKKKKSIAKISKKILFTFGVSFILLSSTKKKIIKYIIIEIAI